MGALKPSSVFGVAPWLMESRLVFWWLESTKSWILGGELPTNRLGGLELTLVIFMGFLWGQCRPLKKLGWTNPGYKWDKWGQCPLITWVITHLPSGMNHQVPFLCLPSTRIENPSEPYSLDDPMIANLGGQLGVTRNPNGSNIYESASLKSICSSHILHVWYI